MLSSEMASVQELARQLSDQLESNNELIQQVGLLESQHLAFQRAVAEKQTQLRQALQVADAAKAEGNDLRRKLAVSQDIASKAAEEVKNLKVDNTALKRQVESQESSLNDLKHQLADSQIAKNAVASELESLKRQHRTLEAKQREDASENEERISALQQQNAILAKELSDHRSRQAPMHAELESLRASLSKVQAELEGSKKARAEATARAERAISACAERDSALQEAQALEGRLGRALEEERGKVAAADRRIASMTDALAGKDAEIQSALARERDAAAALQAAKDEVLGLRREAEALGMEVINISKARAAEGEAYEARLKETLEDLRRIADEARAREAAHAVDTAKHAEELIAVRRQAAAAIETAHADAESLAAVLEKERGDAAASLRGSEEKRAALEKAMTDLQARTAAAEVERAKAMAAMQAAMEDAKAESGRVKEALVRNAEQYCSTLGDLQAALREVRAEAGKARDEAEQSSAKVQRLQGKLDEAQGPAAQAPLDAWYEEARRTFVLLGDRVQAERKRADGERDNTRAAEMACEELRARVLMLEEGLSKAEHEASTRGALLKQAQATAASREEAAATEIRAAAAVAAELQAEIARLREKVDKGTKARIALQAELSKAQGETADISARHTSRVAALEEQISGLQGTVDTLSKQVDELGETAARLQVTVEAQGAALDGSRKEKAAMQAEADRAADAAKASIAAYAAQVSALSDGMRAMEKQLKSTQGLLSVVKEQKAALAEANAQLRAELDAIYSSSLAGTAGMEQGEQAYMTS